MYPFSIIEDEIVGKLSVEEHLIIDGIEVVVNKLFLNRSIIPLNIGINLWTPGIGEEMEDLIFLQLFIKISKVLTTVIGLPYLDLSWIDRFESFIEVLHVSTVQLLVIQGQGKF